MPCADDIAVSALRRVRDDAHARFDAVQREYKYYVALRKDPFRRDTAFRYALPLDTERMNEAAALLVGCGDFTSFAKLHSNNKTNVWPRRPGPVGSGGRSARVHDRRRPFSAQYGAGYRGDPARRRRGKMSPEDMRAVIDGRSRSLSGCSAPAHGLFLTDVKYPDGSMSTLRTKSYDL